MKLRDAGISTYRHEKFGNRLTFMEQKFQSVLDLCPINQVKENLNLWQSSIQRNKVKIGKENPGLTYF